MRMVVAINKRITLKNSIKKCAILFALIHAAKVGRHHEKDVTMGTKFMTRGTNLPLIPRNIPILRRRNAIALTELAVERAGGIKPAFKGNSFDGKVGGV